MSSRAVKSKSNGSTVDSGGKPKCTGNNVDFGAISPRVEPRMGKLHLMGRYHRLPRKLSDEYKLTSKILGTGFSGGVRMATSVNLQSKQPFAVKIFRTKGMKQSKLAQLEAEIEIFLCMDHPQVARLVDVYESENSLALVMECMSGGELFNRILKCKHFGEEDAACATRQMLLAVNYIHSHGIVHRDLKLENFLYDTEGSDHLKLIDFGFSKFLDAKSRMRTSCGTLSYVAPEVLRQDYTSQCDLWSMGVIVFILLSGHMPFYGQDDKQVQDIAAGNYIMKAEHWKDVSKAGCVFVRSLLQLDPDKRLTAKAALKDPWISGLWPAPRLDFKLTIFALRSWPLAPKLLRALFCMMAWSLTNEQQATVREHFLAMDRNHDGGISLSELRYIMAMHGVSEAEVASIFKVLVEGHDREMHYSDFLAAMACEYLELDDDILLTTFQKFDTRGVGYINAIDLNIVMGADRGFDGSQADALLCQADTIKRDGHIDYDEFVQYVRSARMDWRDRAKLKFDLVTPSSLQVHDTSPLESKTAPTLLEHRHPQRIDADRKDILPRVQKSTCRDDYVLHMLNVGTPCCSLM